MQCAFPMQSCSYMQGHDLISATVTHSEHSLSSRILDRRKPLGCTFLQRALYCLTTPEAHSPKATTNQHNLNTTRRYSCTVNALQTIFNPQTNAVKRFSPPFFYHPPSPLVMTSTTPLELLLCPSPPLAKAPLLRRPNGSRVHHRSRSMSDRCRRLVDLRR